MTPEQVYPATRKCTHCLLDLPLESFRKARFGKYGRNSRCKKCCTKLHTEWARKNKEIVNRIARESNARHREQRREDNRIWRKENFETYAEMKARRGPEWMKKKIRQVTLYKYGVNGAWFDDMRSTQNGCCGICGNPCPQNARGHHQLFVDHDHSCCGDYKGCRKCVRGLLCRKCNIRLGSVDDMEWLQKAIAYLNRFRTHHIALSVPSVQPTNTP